MEKDFGIIFGNLVKRLRTDLGCSQEALAHKCKIHRTYMGELERGKNQPGLRVLHRIARAFGLSLSELIILFEADVKAYRKAQREAKKEATAAASSETFVEVHPAPQASKTRTKSAGSVKRSKPAKLESSQPKP